MEEMSFGIVADTLEEIGQKLQRCYNELNFSRDEKRQQLGDSMHCLKQDCGKLENELRNLEQMQYHLKDLVDDAQQNEKVKRR